MAKEATIRVSLGIRKTDPADNSRILLDYQSRPTGFNIDVTGVKGPTPGAIAVPPSGVDVDLSELTTPGLVVIYNLDPDDTIHYGIRDPENDIAFMLGQVRPGCNWPLELSTLLTKEVEATGTGFVAGNNRLHLRAGGVSTISGRVDAFEA